MDLSYYNNEVDKIMWDIVGDDWFTDDDLPSIIKTVANTIYQYDDKISKPKLKLVVQFLISQKYQKYYIYDTSSKYNEIMIAKNENKPVDKKINSDTISVTASDLKDADNLENSPVKPAYINSEIKGASNDKIQLISANDLVSHRHDYAESEYKETIYIKRRKRVAVIKQIPQHEQKSKEWLTQRNECLTATAIAIVLDEDPYKFPAELLLDKCGKGEPFKENENVHHGKKYEQIGNMFYSFRNNVVVGEYGLIQHEKYKFVGASPDGICDKNTFHNAKLTKLIGRLLEIKFPKTRKICLEGELDGDICPHYYYQQIQTQLFVTGLDECDFLQCQMEEYDSWEDYVQDTNPNIPGLSKKTNLEKGCLIQLFPKKMAAGDPAECLYNSKYIYPPKLHMTHAEIEKWVATEIMNFHTNELSKDYLVDRVICWRLVQVVCHLIKSNTQYFESKIPLLRQFWDYVEFYRANPKKLDRLVEYIKEIGVRKSSEIFAKVHKDYISINKKSKYQPLYQEETAWRKKYNIKYANYQKFKEFKDKKAATAKKKFLIGAKKKNVG